jgi:ketosteroid isomerase-like protein
MDSEMKVVFEMSMHEGRVVRWREIWNELASLDRG